MTQALPPTARSQHWQAINQAALEGLFKLQVCADCERVQYPPQEFCSRCLGDALSWETVDAGGKVLSWTCVRAGNNEFLRACLPLHVGLIKLDCGPVIFAYLAGDCLQSGCRVRIAGKPDKSGQTVFLALSPDSENIDEFSAILLPER